MFKYNLSKGNAQQCSWSPRRYSRTFQSIKMDQSIPLRDGSVDQTVELVVTLQMWNLGMEGRGPHTDYRGQQAQNMGVLWRGREWVTESPAWHHDSSFPQLP